MSTTMAAPAPTSAGRLDFVDGMRGIACLYVILYHVFLLWPVSSHVSGGSILPIQLLTRVAAYGHVGVDIFLALSGFCLFYPLCRRAISGPKTVPSLHLGLYARRRARRILPAYFVTLAMFSLLPLWPVWNSDVSPVPSLVELVTHALMVHNLFPSTILRIDGPLWSLGLEVQLYVVFPLLVILFRRLGPLFFSIAMFCACAAFRVWAWEYLGGRSAPLDAQFTLMASLPARVFEFAAGMVAAYVLTRSRSKAAEIGSRWALIPLIVLSLALGYATDKEFGEQSPIPALAWGIVGYGLVVAAGSGAFSVVQRFLSWAPLVRLGLASYSVYLLHEPILRFTGAEVARLGMPPIWALCLFLLGIGPCILIFGAGFFFIFERPFTRFTVGHGTHLSARPDVAVGVVPTIGSA